MKTIAYHTVDKSSWGHGEWDNEPDKVQWQDEATGLPCLAVRARLGNWCGYVGITEEHPWHGKDYSNCVRPEADHDDDGWHYDCTPNGMINVHGELTFSGACTPDPDESRDICHTPEPGEPDNVWWFGFDCCHFDDETPAVPDEYRYYGRGRTYRNLSYVQTECADLARQLCAEE